MKLKNYFESTKGLGVLSTADNNGKVNAAIYSRPHFMEDGSLAFIMRDRLTHKNIQSNPHASYLFREDGSGYTGKRLYLTKIREEQDSDLIDSLSRRSYSSGPDRREARFLVFFNLESERPLVGDTE
ncbi:MAG: pyridoxamine 5'-phosphate oxidase family protein [Proteobacteria bacterium]|nr:pyridoxamine 5'-phosphate oxidase family protein [Pseudomonadota bacterium]